MFIKLVMPSNHLILCCHVILLPSIFPSIRVFFNELALRISGQSIRASASASVLPVTIQDWFSLGWTGWISLQSKELSRVFSNTTVQKINSSVLSFLYGPTLTSIHDHWKKRSFDYRGMHWQSDISAFYMLSSFVIAFLPRSKSLLISWLQSPSAVILEPSDIYSCGKINGNGWDDK